MALLSLAAIDIDRFDIPFVQPIKIGSEILYSREGFIVTLTDEEGRTGFGEVAPLPGLDETSLEQCLSELAAAKNRLQNLSLNPGLFDILTPWLGMASLPVSFSSHTLFGLESAFMSLYLQCKLTEGPTNTISLPDPLKVPVNGLFIPKAEHKKTISQISALQACGMKIVKVKIGRLPADEEIHQILSLADTIGKELTLRLDGNKALSAQTYAHYFSALRHLNVEYAEEPLRDGEPVVSPDVSWPQALDESLPQYLDSRNPDLAKLPPEIRIIILKPGLLAGLHGIARCIEDAKKQNIKTVLSSAFNTGITLATLGAFSVLANLSPDTAHGLDTLRYLKSDVLSDSPVIREGVLMIPRRLLSEGMRLNSNVLSKENR